MVNRYVLIKEYNPAYSYWLRAHLREKRILGDGEYSWREAQDIIIDMKNRGKRDDFFQKYFSAWGDHPEYAPNYFKLLRTMLPIDKEDGKLDLTVIAKLDAEARTLGRRILFTVEDAAKDFYEFYDKFLTKPLGRDLERGTQGKELADYFEYEEFTKVPDLSIHGPERVEKVTQEVARNLLEWLRGITREKILEDTKSTLDQHYDKGLAEASPQDSYYHKSEYVAISAHRSEGRDKPVKTFLRPARNYGVIKEGYRGVYYPMYYVELAVQ